MHDTSQDEHTRSLVGVHAVDSYVPCEQLAVHVGQLPPLMYRPDGHVAHPVVVPSVHVSHVASHALQTRSLFPEHACDSYVEPVQLAVHASHVPALL